jgi:rhodanese-related sulfurtransferase
LSTLGTVAVSVLAVVAVAYLALRYWRRRLFRQGLALPRVGVEELHSLIDAGDAPVIVDVRSNAARQIDNRRLPGAVAVELRDIERWAEKQSRDGELVLYCNCPNEASAARASHILAAKGFSRVRALTGGIDGWVASGHGIEFDAPAVPAPAMAAPGD